MLEDPTGALGIADVAALTFAAMPPILVAGYSDSAFWLKLTVRPEPGDDALVLRAWPTYVDQLALYSPDGSGGWTADVTGDRVPFADRSTVGVSLAFSIAPKAETTYYLRLKTSSTSMLGVEAMPHGELFAEDLRFGMVGAIIIGLMIAMLIWAGLEYVATREALMVWYIAAQAISVIYGVCLTGYLGLLLPWAQLDGLTSAFVWAATFSQLLFYLQLLRKFDVPPGASWIAGPLVIAEIAAPLLMLAGLTRIGLQLNAIVVLLAPPGVTILAFLARGNAPPGRNVVRLAGLLQTSALVVSSFPVLGIAAATVFSRHGLLVHGALSGALAFLILRARSTQVRRAAVELGLARRQLEVERHEHDVRGRFLAMLSHELKTPLSVIRLSLPAIPAESPARSRVSGAIDSMATLIDLSTCAARLEQGQLPVAHEPVPVAEIIGRIAAETPARGRLDLRGVAPLQLRTDPQLFDVVVRNLVDNALKYSPPESAVDIVVRESEGGGPNGVIITVENLIGRGLPDPEKMFEKFYRGPGATSRAGLGLGLYVVRGVAELLGGTVKAKLDGTRLRLEVWHPC